MQGLRRALDALYLAGGVAGAAAIVAIGALVLVQIVGRQVGFHLPGSDDLTAYTVAASATLPLAYTFRHGAHIRVDIVIGRFSGGARHALELVVLTIASAIALLFAFSCLDTLIDSWTFDEVAQGMLAVPIWIPQIPLVLGSALFALALTDDLVVAATGGEPSYRRAAGRGAAERAAEEL
ncbi:MAG: TRAP transporter small permease [Elioraea sp.]|nr:TRAP transporter small permease [Elioraea sp.]MDW8443414.1 TRAP transporter small permease [Acetobacteraceae bacterium]